MAKRTNLTGDDALFIGTDQAIDLHVKNRAETASIDITGWAIQLMVKAKPHDADASALLTTSTTIAGTFNADPDTNTQRATATIADTDTTTFAPGARYYEFKRTDAGLETVLAYGRIQIARAVHIA